METRTLFDVQKRGINVQDVHFLEASAGTGKTFAIEHLVTRLILETSVTIDQILVMTFTRAAARELKMRIRSNLARSKEALEARESGGSTVDYLLEIIEQGHEAIVEAVKKIEAALICFDAAQIFTIHGFCHRMLSEFAFECKIACELRSPEQADPTLYYKMVVEDFLLHKLSSRDYSARQLMVLLKKNKSDPNRLIGKIVSLLSGETDIASYPSLQELYERFLTMISAYPSIIVPHFLEDFQRLKDCYKGMNNPVFLQQVEEIAEIVHRKMCSKTRFEELLSHEEWFLDQMDPVHLKVKKALPQESDLHYPEIFSRLKKELLPCIKEASSPMKILLRLSKDCQAHAEEFLVHRECFSPDSMLRRLDQALDVPSFADAVRKKYKAAIIDEFQDTDPVQWGIFKRLFASTSTDSIKTICLVGDPKQSIYAFRSADIYTYLDAAKMLGKEKHKYLDTNFRSSPELIATLNALFSSPQGKGWLALPKIQGAMPVHAVKAGSKQAGVHALVSRGAVHFFLASSDRGRSSQWPTSDCEESQLFPFIVSEISALRKKRDLAWEEIAILVKDRFQAMRLHDYLKQSGIPSSFRRGETIVNSDAWYAFRHLLEAVLYPSDLSRLKIALGGPLIGCGEALLRSKLDEPLLQHAKAKIQSLHNILYKKGFGPFFKTFLATIFPPEVRSIGEKILYRKEITLYRDLCTLADLLIEEEVLSKLQGEDFLRRLEEMQRTPEDGEHRFESRPLEPHGSVGLMTVHLSKGLEFDTVFALALASRHIIKEDEVVKDSVERSLIAFDDENPACQQAMQEIDAEKMRSLYVALTRAKQQLYIPFIIDESQKMLKVGDASPIELFLAKMSKECHTTEELYEEIIQLDLSRIQTMLNALSTTCSLTYDPIGSIRDEPDKIDGKDEIKSVAINPPSHVLYIPEPQWLLSFTSIASKQEESEAALLIDPIEHSIEYPRDELPVGAATGILVHRIFECIFKRSLHHPLQNKKIEDLIALEIERNPFVPFKQKLIDMVMQQLDMCLLPHGLRLKHVPASQMIQELEFFFPSSANAMMKGFADLVFSWEDKYYLLDWKSNCLGVTPQDYSQKAMQIAMRSHQYFLQASIYATALKRYVKLFDKRPFEEIFGGAFYVFVRGGAVFHFFPDEVVS